MQEICPVSNEQINERIARSNAAIVSLLLFAFLYSGYSAIILFLLMDFFIRGFKLNIPSPIGLMSRYAIRILNFGYKPINAAPKVFAAKIGFVFSGVIGLFSLLDFSFAAYIFSSVMLTFALLESIVGLCIACKVYSFLKNLINE